MVNRVVHIDCLLQRQVLPAPPSSSVLPTGAYSSGIYINGAWHVWSGRSRRDGEAVRDQPVRPLGRAQLLMLSSCLSNLPLATVGLLLLPCIHASCRFYVDISSTLIKCVDFNVFLIFHAYPRRIFRCRCCCCCWPTGSGWAAAGKLEKGCKWTSCLSVQACPVSCPVFLFVFFLFCFVLR